MTVGHALQDAAGVANMPTRVCGAALNRSLDRIEFGEARSFLAMIRREQPQLSIDWIRASVPYQTPELMERFLAVASHFLRRFEMLG